MNEWKTLSRSMPRGDIHINDIGMPSLREFDINHAWSHPEVSTTKIEFASNYIDYNRIEWTSNTRYNLPVYYNKHIIP